MRILITGITGCLGEALCSRLVSEGHEVTGLARDEGKLIALKERFPEITIMIGDVADKWTVKQAMLGAEGIYHLAAQKHVGLAENFVIETINSNILGTVNILEESWESLPKFILGVSTDKAGSPKGVYGATKLLMERLFKQAENLNPYTCYRIVRYGNVMGSTGSFITKWKPLMQAGKEIKLTDPEATRFYWSVEEAVDFIYECLDKAKDSTPFIPNMKAISMQKALEVCQEVYGKCPVKIIGLQSGENLHESIDGITYSNQAEQYTKQEFKQKFL